MKSRRIYEMHIALCEWMGWKWKDGNWTFRGKLTFTPWKKCKTKFEDISMLPPLTLDWMRECEEKLFRNEDDLNAYDTLLHLEVYPTWHASKNQRMEAMCRTLFPERFKT